MNIKRIHIPLYNTTFLTAVGSKQDFADHVIVKYKTDVSNDLLDMDAGVFFLDAKHNYQDCLVFLEEETLEPSTLVHEMIHMSWFILDRVGIKIDVNNHEAQTYLVEFLVNEITKKFKL